MKNLQNKFRDPRARVLVACSNPWHGDDFPTGLNRALRNYFTWALRGYFENLELITHFVPIKDPYPQIMPYMHYGSLYIL